MNNTTDSNRCDVLFSAALEAEKRGLYSHADRLLAKVAESNLRDGIENNKNYLGMLLQFADLCADDGRFERAEAIYRNVLALLLQSRGPNHLSTALAMRNLADICLKLGKNMEAAELNNTANSTLSENFHELSAIDQ